MGFTSLDFRFSFNSSAFDISVLDRFGGSSFTVTLEVGGGLAFTSGLGISALLYLRGLSLDSLGVTSYHLIVEIKAPWKNLLFGFVLIFFSLLSS